MQRTGLAVLLLLGALCVAAQEPNRAVRFGADALGQQQVLVASGGNVFDDPKKVIEIPVENGIAKFKYGTGDKAASINTRVSLKDGVVYAFSMEKCTGSDVVDNKPVPRMCKKKAVSVAYDDTDKTKKQATPEFKRAALSGSYYKDEVQFTEKAEDKVQDVWIGVVESGPVTYEAVEEDAYFGLGSKVDAEGVVAPVPAFLDKLSDPYIAIYHQKDDTGKGVILVGNITHNACPQKQSKFFSTVKDGAVDRWAIRSDSIKIADVTKENLTVSFDLSVKGVHLPSDFIAAVKKVRDDKGLVSDRKSIPALHIKIDKEYFVLNNEDLSVSSADNKWKDLVEEKVDGETDVVLGRAFLKQYCVTLSRKDKANPTIAISEPRVESFAPALGFSLLAALLLPLLNLVRW